MKWFCWDEKLFLGQKKREYIDNWRDFLLENNISELHIKNNRCDYVYVNMQTFVVFNYMLVWEKVFLDSWYFSLWLTFLWKHSLIKTVPLDRCLLMYVVKILYKTSLSSFLTWINLVIFCLDHFQIEIVCSAQRHWCMNLERWQLLVCWLSYI